MRNALCGAVAGEKAAVDFPVVIFFLCFWRIYREAVFTAGEFLIADFFFGHFFEGVDPVVAYSVRELLLLPPANAFGEQILEGLSQNPFFDALFSLRKADVHFVAGVKSHGDVDEVLVQERNTALNTPGHKGLVCPQAVVKVKLAHFSHQLLVEFFGIRSLVEVKIASKKLVASLAGKNHLDAHRLDYPGKKIHWG